MGRFRKRIAKYAKPVAAPHALTHIAISEMAHLSISLGIPVKKASRTAAKAAAVPL
jgi:hypothetical protein